MIFALLSTLILVVLAIASIRWGYDSRRATSSYDESSHGYSIDF
ncbi:hypothetical protein [Dictyobacter arantiisoli]|uniref:Uncharacterized protein n=1 Tax=Dictyobacter arantiisoli TaxID=2014874 RepID=A0A5A5TKB7_9CHLR|nr:hypothetical protein [Dictyobacter arantiisoli]GCF11479.1 hypothetical protein KDI_50430 [Dictyobacter arantiisoli]